MWRFWAFPAFATAHAGRAIRFNLFAHTSQKGFPLLSLTRVNVFDSYYIKSDLIVCFDSY